MREQLASLTARFNGKGGGKEGSRHGWGGGRTLDPSTDTLSCYECGKQGHLRPNCPGLPGNKKKLNKAEDSDDHAESAVALVASTSTLSSASSSASPSPDVTWVIDSGTSRHCSAVLSDFADLKISVVGSVSGIGCEVKGVGDVEVTVCNKIGSPITLTLKEVLYVLGLRERSKGLYLRLLSVTRATLVGCHCTFSKDEDVLDLLTSPPVILVRRCGLIWLLNFQEPTTVLALSPTITRDFIHRRCGHLHEAGLEKLDKLGIDGIWGYSLLPPFSFCHCHGHCDIAKSKTAKVNRKSTRDNFPPSPFHTIALDI